MELLIHWLPFALLFLVLVGSACLAYAVRTGRLVTEPLSEPSRRSYAVVVLAIFLLAAALGQSAYPIPLGIAMAMVVYHGAVRYHKPAS